MHPELKKIVTLVGRTGDRCIIVNENGDPSYVVLSFHEYEKLLESQSKIQELSEEEFLEKINRDIAIWRSGKEDERFSEWEFDDLYGLKAPVAPQSRGELDAEDDETTQPEETYYFEPID